MDTYAAVKAELGDGPPYANRRDFTTYYGYRAGKVIGKFDTKVEATDAGAATVDKTVDEDAYNAARTAYQEHQAKLGHEFHRRLRESESDLSDEVFNLVYGEAYERGHSAGYHEVELYVSEIADFARKVRAAQ